jgi:hypothetical protein
MPNNNGVVHRATIGNNPRFNNIIRERHDIFPFYSKFECVYFLKSRELVKIGATESPYVRFNALKTDNAFPELVGMFIRKDCKNIEKKIHIKFFDYAVRGEWFYYNNDIIEFINRHMNDYDKLGFSFYKRYVDYNKEHLVRRINEIHTEQQNKQIMRSIMEMPK